MGPDASLAFFMAGMIIVVIMLGIPVAFALASVPLLFGIIFLGPFTMPLVVMNAFGMMTNYVFVAVPLFIFMGALMERSGIADQLYESFYHLLGRLPGGLAIATVAMATVFGACTGIIGAGVITIGLLALPAMLKRGYSKPLATGAIMVGGGLGVTIPPSVMLILYGGIAGVSIAKLFIAAIIPGIMLGALYILYIYIRAKISPELGRPISKEERITGLKLAKMVSKSLVPPVILILAVLGSIFFGIVSPSEAGGMGVLGAFILIVCYRKFTMKLLIEAFTATLRIASAIIFVCLAGQIFTGIFITMGGDAGLTAFLQSFDLNPMGTVLLMLAIIFVLGMVMDWIALIFILVPIYGPILKVIGVDPLYFGILFCTTLEIANMTPPFAYSVFYMKTIAPPEVTIGDMYKGCIPFALVDAGCTILLLLFPALVLWLPGFM